MIIIGLVVAMYGFINMVVDIVEGDFISSILDVLIIIFGLSMASFAADYKETTAREVDRKTGYHNIYIQVSTEQGVVSLDTVEIPINSVINIK